MRPTPDRRAHLAAEADELQRFSFGRGGPERRCYPATPIGGAGSMLKKLRGSLLLACQYSRPKQVSLGALRQIGTEVRLS